MPKTPNKKKNPSKIKHLLFKHHLRAAHNGWSQIRQAPANALITCTVIAMTILLTTLLFLTVKSFQHVALKMNANNQVTVYLKSTHQEAQIESWIKTLKNNKLVRNVTYISPQQALAELSQLTEYKNLLTDIQDNILPPVVLLQFNIKEKQQVERFVHQLRGAPFVEAIHLDFKWVERLLIILKLADRLSYALALLFGIGVLFIIAHTIEGATQKNHQEIFLLQLIGAKLPYTRRPLLYLGLFLGLGASLVTLVFLGGLFFMIKDPLFELLRGYNIEYHLLPGLIKMFLLMASLSIFLGWLGAWIAFYRYAKRSCCL